MKGKVVLLRADLNVPIQNGKVVDDFRIKKTLPTILYLKKKGARIIIVSHSDLKDDTQSLRPAALDLAKYVNVRFIPESVPKNVSFTDAGEVILLENIRFEKGEKKNSPELAKRLASLADIYVNDAFAVSHREHASIVGVPKYLPAYAGLQLEAEVKYLSTVFSKPKHPFLFILGGNKFSTKLPLVKRYLPRADTLFIGGALANQVFFESGKEIGLSLIEKEKSGLKNIAKRKNVLLPVDVEVQEKDGSLRVSDPDDIRAGESMVDAGPATIKALVSKISQAKMILWNGPLGKSGVDGDMSTKALLRAIGKSHATSIVGGGDTVEVINELKMEKKLTFVSTGGGAMLDYLAKGTLPGIKALK